MDFMVLVRLTQCVGGGGIRCARCPSYVVFELGRLVLTITRHDADSSRREWRRAIAPPAKDGDQPGVRIGLLRHDMYALRERVPSDPTLLPSLGQRLPPLIEEFSGTSADDHVHLRLPAFVDAGQRPQQQRLRCEDSRHPDEANAVGVAGTFGQSLAQRVVV